MFVSLNSQKDILAKDIMTREVVSVSPSDSIREAYQRLAQSGFSGLPVVEGGLVVGLLTSHDIIAKGGNIDTPALVSRLIKQRLTGGGRYRRIGTRRIAGVRLEGHECRASPRAGRCDTIGCV